jgi:uncharacterized protein (DUF58 family)
VTEETRKALKEISQKVLAVQIPVRWRSKKPLLGAGQRKTKSKGTDGFQIVTREKFEWGDSPRDIDWRAAAQAPDDESLDTLHFEETHQIDVNILVDIGRLMEFGSTRVDKRMLAAEVAASIIASCKKTDDVVRVVCYSNRKVEARLPARTPKNAMSPAIVSILETKETAGGTPTRTGLAEAVRSVPMRRSLTYILSDFMNMSEDEKQSIKHASALHDVVCVVLQDPREQTLPDGWGLFTLEDIATGARKTIWLNAKNRASFARNSQQRLQDLLKFFRAARCNYGEFSTEQGEAAKPALMRMLVGHTSRG